MLGSVDYHFEKPCYVTNSDTYDMDVEMEIDELFSPHGKGFMTLCADLKQRSSDRYIRGDQLGGGSYGDAFEAEDTYTGKLVHMHFVEPDLETKCLRSWIADSKLKFSRMIFQYAYLLSLLVNVSAAIWIASLRKI